MGRPETLTRYQLYIGGRWVEPAGKGYFPSYNPYTQEPWAEIPQAGPEDVRAAVAAARDAFDCVWSKTSGYDRAKLMFRLADIIDEEAPRLGRLETTDNGKVLRETSSQMIFLARVLRFYAGYADKIWGKVMPLDRSDVFDYATMEPLGVIGIITAWTKLASLAAAMSAARLLRLPAKS